MYVVRFVRADGKSDEEYWYHRLEDAEYHFGLFRNDTETLFSEIHLLKDSSSQRHILEKIGGR